jgi:hypothetical protein
MYNFSGIQQCQLLPHHNKSNDVPNHGYMCVVKQKFQCAGTNKIKILGVHLRCFMPEIYQHANSFL